MTIFLEIMLPQQKLEATKLRVAPETEMLKVHLGQGISTANFL